MPIFSFSQELKLVKDQVNEFTILQYQVLASNPKIRQGLYQKYFSSKLILIEDGYYKNNEKDSTWSYFDLTGRVTSRGGYINGLRTGAWRTFIYKNDTSVCIKEGNYFNGIAAGEWIFRNTNGSIDYKYDYTKRVVTAYGKNDEIYTLIDRKDTIITNMDKPLIHLGGTDTLMRLLSKNLRIPVTYPTHGISERSGTYRVLVSFDVDENGKPENYKVLKGNNKLYNDEALRVIKLWDDGNWIPGYYAGHAVKVIQIVPIVFNLSVDKYIISSRQ